MYGARTIQVLDVGQWTVREAPKGMNFFQSETDYTWLQVSRFQYSENRSTPGTENSVYCDSQKALNGSFSWTLTYLQNGNLPSTTS